MAFVRSCYTTQARFFYDSADTYPIIWYFAQSGSPRFQGRHTFAPLSLSGGSAYPSGNVGEVVGSPRPWRNGSIPVAYPTGILDGAPSQFYLGQSTQDPGIVRTDFGIPANCTSRLPGVYCDQSVGVNQNFQLYDLERDVIGYMNWSSVNSEWTVRNLVGDFAGYGLCYNIGTPTSPVWVLSIITNLFTGTPGQFIPYPPFDVPPIILYQSITTSIGPAVGSISEVP